MAISSGFFPSNGGDRKYGVEQMSQLFDGLISDGIYSNVGEGFVVAATSPESANACVIKSGRAWFKGTWIYNDADLLYDSLPVADISGPRYDAIVIRVDKVARQNTIEYISGNPVKTGLTPPKPEIKNTENVFNYPLAYILRKQGDNVIKAGDITTCVGKETPFVAGVANISINMEAYWSQWSSLFSSYMDSKDAEFLKWFNGVKDILAKEPTGELASLVSSISIDVENEKTRIQPISLGGTGASDITNARQNLGIVTSTEAPEATSKTYKNTIYVHIL